MRNSHMPSFAASNCCSDDTKWCCKWGGCALGACVAVSDTAADCVAIRNQCNQLQSTPSNPTQLGSSSVCWGCPDCDTGVTVVLAPSPPPNTSSARWKSYGPRVMSGVRGKLCGSGGDVALVHSSVVAPHGFCGALAPLNSEWSI